MAGFRNYTKLVPSDWNTLIKTVLKTNKNLKLVTDKGFDWIVNTKTKKPILKYDIEEYKVHSDLNDADIFRIKNGKQMTESTIDLDKKWQMPKRGDTVKYTRELELGKTSKETSKVVMIHGNNILLDNGDTLDARRIEMKVKMHESKGSDELKSLKKQAKKYKPTDVRYKEIQKKIHDLESDKAYGLPGSKAHKKFNESKTPNKLFKKGDKVKYLGNPAVISSVREYNGAFYYSLKYKKPGEGTTDVNGILAKHENGRFTDTVTESINEGPMQTKDAQYIYTKYLKGKKPNEYPTASVIAYELTQDGYSKEVTTDYVRNIMKKFKNIQLESVNESSNHPKGKIYKVKHDFTYEGNPIRKGDEIEIIGTKSSDNKHISAWHIPKGEQNGVIIFVSINDLPNLVKESINEDLPTKSVDKKEFPNPLTKTKRFLKKGERDGDTKDDQIPAKDVTIAVSKLKPSQDAIYLGKALGMAIGGVEGGNLDAVISKDNYILDGHHRYAATSLNNPSATVGGLQVDLIIGDLIPVLRSAGDAMNNARGVEPKGGDLNIFKATIQDVKDAVYNGKNMNPSFYDKDKAVAWFESKGEKVIEQRLKQIQSKKPPAGAPARKDMPKIRPNQVGLIKKLLTKGKIDVKAPYAENVNELNTKETESKFIKKYPDAKITTKKKGKDVIVYVNGETAYNKSDHHNATNWENMMLRAYKASKLKESVNEDKVYIEKTGGILQLWNAYSQGSGNTIQLSKTSYITDKSGDKNFNSNVPSMIKDIRSNYKTILKAQNSTLHKIPVYPSTSGGKFTVWGGDVKPVDFHYLVVSDSGTTKVITYFNNKNEARGWMKSMTKESVNESTNKLKQIVNEDYSMKIGKRIAIRVYNNLKNKYEEIDALIKDATKNTVTYEYKMNGKVKTITVSNKVFSSMTKESTQNNKLKQIVKEETVKVMKETNESINEDFSARKLSTKKLIQMFKELKDSKLKILIPNFFKEVQMELIARKQMMAMESVNESNKLFNSKYISSVEYQKAKKLKGFDPKNFKWDSSKTLYRNLKVESVNESSMSDLDILAQESKDLNDFKKKAFKEVPSIKKGPKGETDKWLKDIYDEAKKSMNEGEISNAKMNMLGTKLLRKIKVGSKFKTNKDTYTVTGYGNKSNAFQEFDVDDSKGNPKKVKLTVMYGVKLEISDDPRSARFSREEELESLTESVPKK